MDKEANKYEFPNSILRRGKEEVRTLLGVEEVQEERPEAELDGQDVFVPHSAESTP